MARKRFSPEQIITMLREAEVLFNQARRLKELEQESARLKKPVRTYPWITPS